MELSGKLKEVSVRPYVSMYVFCVGSSDAPGSLRLLSCSEVMTLAANAAKFSVTTGVKP